MNPNDPKNLRGFTGEFAQEFVLPQISFWMDGVYQKPSNVSGLEAEYYESMERAAKDLQEKFSPPYNATHPGFPLHEVVINIEEVERLKGIIGDNYRWLKKRVEEKKALGASFLKTDPEEKKLRNIESYLNNLAPNLSDAYSRHFFSPFPKDRSEGEIVDQTQKSSSSQQGIFLCYSSKDKGIVRWFRDRFEEEGIKVWFDESEILTGDSMPKKIAEGMKKCEFVAIFISENLNIENMSPWIGWELEMAKMKELQDNIGRIIPIMIGKSPSVKPPQEIVEKNYADFRGRELKKDDPEFKRLMRKIKNQK